MSETLNKYKEAKFSEVNLPVHEYLNFAKFALVNEGGR